MRLIKPSFQIIKPTGYTIDDIYKSIELAGRVSYKSEDRITEDSAKSFVERMMKMKHLSTCEFGTVYLYIDYHNPSFGKIVDKYNNNEYSKCIIDTVFPNKAYISSNYRVLIENNWLDDLKYLCEPTEYHHKRYIVKFICDRAIANEFVRHRKFSFLQESTRYCNYSKDKFGNELTFIIPEWCPEIREDSNKGWDPCSIYDKFYLQHLQMAEDIYFNLLKQWDEKVPDKRYKSGFRNNPWTPQQARNILPLSLKTELYMCGFAEDWEQFFKLRTAPNAHPQARELAIPLREEFIKNNFISNEKF